MAMSEEELRERESWTTIQKENYTIQTILKACIMHKWNISVSFSGGKDSQVLLDMTAWMWKKSEEEHGKKPLNVVFSNTSNEFAKMELFVKEYCDLMERKHDIKIRLYVVRGEKTYYEVVKDIGYPVVSKTTCRKVRDIRKWIKKEKIKWEDISDKLDNGIESANLLRKLGASNTVVLYLTGIRKDNTEGATQSRLPKKWRPLIIADFEVSEECCTILKKIPQKRIQNDIGSIAIIGEMAEESQNRRSKYKKTGCFVTSGKKIMVKPMGFWLEKNVLEYIKKYDLPTFFVYGKLVEENGELRFTGEQRTGCKLCLFGIQFDTERLKRLKQIEPQTYKFAVKPVEEGGLGYRKVIEYINKKCGCNVWIDEEGA